MRITCETKDALPLDALTEFQGGLKQRDDSDYQKIRKSIERYGFATPFFVWKHENANYVLDGHGRLETLKRMQEDGENIPILPVVYVDCKNEADAKNLLLRINSTYGKMTAESVLDFMREVEIDFDEISLPFGVLNFESEIQNLIDNDFGGFDDLDGKKVSLKDNDLANVTFTFSLAEAELIRRIVKLNGKGFLVRKIVDICNEVEV